MKLPRHYAIGHLKKAYGRKGAFRYHIDEEYRDQVDSIDHIFLEIEGQYIPFFIAKFSDDSPPTIKFESIDTPEEAKRRAGATLYVREGQIDRDREEIQGEALIGYKAFEEDGTEIGTIDALREFPHQLMAVIPHEGRELLLPLHPDLIASVNHEEQSIWLSLPEGMLDL